MEIFEMELDKPLEGTPSPNDQQRLSKPFSDDAINSYAPGRFPFRPPHQKQQQPQHNHRPLPIDRTPPHHEPDREHQYHPKWDPAFPSPSPSSSSLSSSSSSSSSGFSVHSISPPPLSPWEDGSPGQRKHAPVSSSSSSSSSTTTTTTTTSISTTCTATATTTTTPTPTLTSVSSSSSTTPAAATPTRKSRSSRSSSSTGRPLAEDSEGDAEDRRAHHPQPTATTGSSSSTTTNSVDVGVGGGEGGTGGGGGGASNNRHYNQMKAKYLRSLNFNEQEVQKRVLSGRSRSMSLPVSGRSPGPPAASQALIQQQHQQLMMGGSSPPPLSSSSPSSEAHPTAIPIPAGGAAGRSAHAGLGLSDFALAESVTTAGGPVRFEASSFVPPHELVKRDTFSVWQYEKKKNAAYKAL